MPGQNCFQSLHHRDDVSIGRKLVVVQGAHLFESVRPIRWSAAEFYELDFLEESPQNLDAVPALRPLAPRLQKQCAVVMIGRVLDLARRAAFYSNLYAALALAGVPHAIVEAELYFLFD